MTKSLRLILTFKILNTFIKLDNSYRNSKIPFIKNHFIPGSRTVNHVHPNTHFNQSTTVDS